MGNKDICGIYGYYDNLKDKVIYVGQSKHISKRHNQHIKSWSYTKQPVNRILQKNPQRYNLIIMKECPVEELDHWEITLIALFNPKFNFNNGGGGNRGFKHSSATKEKLRKALLGRKVSLETRKKISQAKMGHVGYYRHHTMSKETREKISRANMGHPVSLKTRLAVSKAQKGKTLTQAQKDAVSKAHKGKKLPEWRAKKLRGKNNPNYGNRGKKNPSFKDYARVIKSGKRIMKKSEPPVQYYELVYSKTVITRSYKKDKLQKMADDFNKNNGPETFDPKTKTWGNTTLDKYITKRSDNNEENFTNQKRCCE